MVSEWFYEWYFDWYVGFFVPFSGIEWYFKLPLTLPLSPADISLLLNGIQCKQWYNIGSFCKGHFQIPAENRN